MSERWHARYARTEGAKAKDLRRGLFGKPTTVVFWCFVIALCVLLVVPALPQYRLLKEVEDELSTAEKEERILYEKSLRLGSEVRALRKNPEYLQARARDPLRVQEDGETVIQMDK